MKLSKHAPPLAKYINTSYKTRFITQNKSEIAEQEIKNKSANLRNLTQVEFRKYREIQRKEHAKRSKISYIGVDEGLITLPKSKCTKNWKKLSSEEIEARNNYLLNKQLKATLDSDTITKYFIEPETEIQKEKYIKQKQEESEIKKLNNWDIQFAYKKNNISRKNSSNIAAITQGLDSSSIKWMLEIKSNPKLLDVIGRVKHLKDFFLKMEEEQNAIVNQNMNVNKKQFLFDAFEVVEENAGMIAPSTKKFSTVDYYRNIMREKIKVEEFLRNDLATIAEEVYEKKQEKKKMLDQINKLIYEINEANSEMKRLVDTNNYECKKLLESVNHHGKKERDLFSKSNTKDLKFKLQQQTLEMVNETNKKVNKIKEDKITKEIAIDTINKQISTIEDQLRRLKVRVHNRMTEHRKYYFDILKKGIDVRQDGLSWVLVKLIELRTYIENSKFPKFLTTEQINYLMVMAYKRHEVNELIKLFQVLKNKQKELHDQFSNTHKLNDFSKMNFMQNKKIEDTTSYGFQRAIIEEKAMPAKYNRSFEAIALKYENVTNICLNENKEERYVSGIVKDLRGKILTEDNIEDKEEFDELYFLPGSLAEFFNENQKFRQYFDDIFYLNSEIIRREKEITKLKKEQIAEFKKMNETHNKLSNTVENEMTYAALFGNGIML